MKNRAFFWILLILLSLGCGRDKQDEPTRPITLGAIYNLSGGQSSLDLPSSQGAQLVVQQVNDTGGIRGQILELLLKDGQTNTDTLKAAVAEVLEEAPTTLAFLGLSDTDQVIGGRRSGGKRQPGVCGLGSHLPTTARADPGLPFPGLFRR